MKENIISNKTGIMLDIHSHILPSMDDGASNAEESLELLKMTAEQGIGSIIATPHFYAYKEAPEKFLSRREKSVKMLFDACRDVGNIPLPNIYLGAEVAYYPSIGHSEYVSELCTVGTNTLLLEMPFERWSGSVIEEVCELSEFRSVNVVIAHIERYMQYQRRGTLDLLADNGIMLQCNAEFFLQKKTAKKALKLARRGYISFLGSDCHNTSERPQQLGNAIEILKNEKYAEQLFDDISENCKRLFGGALTLEEYLRTLVN